MERLLTPFVLYVALRTVMWTAMPILFALTWAGAASLPVLIVSFATTNTLIAVGLYYEEQARQ